MYETKVVAHFTLVSSITLMLPLGLDWNIGIYELFEVEYC